MRRNKLLIVLTILAIVGLLGIYDSNQLGNIVSKIKKTVEVVKNSW